jgi:hypothetical protein
VYVVKYKKLKNNIMSENKIDKAKVAKKLLQLEKKLNRVEENENPLNRKLKQVRKFKLIEKLKGNPKNKKYVNSKEI